MPATNELTFGTCASTLLPRIRSAGPPEATISPAVSSPKNLTSVSTPFRRAASATFAAGSTPSAGMPRPTKFDNRYPSFEPSSTTRLSGPSRSRSTIMVT